MAYRSVTKERVVISWVLKEFVAEQFLLIHNSEEKPWPPQNLGDRERETVVTQWLQKQTTDFCQEGID
jgi:hypothetical protein